VSAIGFAQILGQGGKLVQHRRKLPLVVGRLDDLGRDHQQTTRHHDRLGVVARLEATARHRHDARLLVGQIDLVGRQGTFDRRLGRLAPGLPTSRRSLGVARRKPGFMVGLLAFEAFLGPCFDLGPRLGELRQTLLAARQLVGDRQAVGEVRPVGRLGLGQQVGHLQLRLDPARMLVGQRAVPAGVGVDLGAVPCPS
jgi:hypothetical protein